MVSVIAAHPPQEALEMNQLATSVLLTCLGSLPDSDKADHLKSVSPETWRVVAAQARRHRIGPLLYYQAQKANITLPNNLAAGLKQAYWRTVRQNMMFYQELDRVLQTLRTHAVPAITLKGLHLAGMVYTNIGLRTMSDMDLLVSQDDLGKVEPALLGLGCKPFHPNRVMGPDNYNFVYILPQTNFIVEVHWALVPARLPFRIDIAGLWARAQGGTVANLPIETLCPEDLLLHLCLHAAKDWSLLRLRMLCDINEIVRHYRKALDWAVIGARAQAWGIVKSVYLMLRLARDLLETAVPADWLAALQPEDFDERYLALAQEQFLAGPNEAEGDPLVSPYVVVQLWGLNGLGRKLALIRDRLLPARETMALMYPAPADSWRIWLYYPVRLKDLLMRYGLTMWQLAQGDPRKQDLVIRSSHARELHEWLISG